LRQPEKPSFLQIPQVVHLQMVSCAHWLSARANDLDVYEYLQYLLEEMPNNHYLENPEILERYLPWSEELPDRCRLKRTYKKCLKQ